MDRARKPHVENLEKIVIVIVASNLMKRNEEKQSCHWRAEQSQWGGMSCSKYCLRRSVELRQKSPG